MREKWNGRKWVFTRRGAASSFPRASLVQQKAAFGRLFYLHRRRIRRYHQKYLKSLVKMKKVGIVGGTGYTGVELLRILATHPDAELAIITSRKEAGTPVADIF